MSNTLTTYRVTYRSPIGRLRCFLTDAVDGLDACDLAVQALRIDYAAITRTDALPDRKAQS